MSDPVNQETKIAMVDYSHPNVKEIENVQQKGITANPKADHGDAVGPALVKQIKADGYLTHPGKVKIQSYIYGNYDINHRISVIKSAIKNNNDIITSSIGSYYTYDYINEYFLSRQFSKHISSFNKDTLMFFSCGNNAKNLFDNNAHHYYTVNNYRVIPVGAIYYKKEFENNCQDPKFKNLKEQLRISSTPGACVFISSSGFYFKNFPDVGSSYSTPYIAGSAGVIAVRHLKPRTQGDFPTLTKKYLGYSAQRINQNELLNGWATESSSQYMRNIEFNTTKDCNFGQGLGFSYEHGTGAYDPIAFYNLCQSHLPEFDVNLIKDSKVYTISMPPSSSQAYQLNLEFDCDEDKGSIDGAYFSFKGLREMDIRHIRLESPDGTKSDPVNNYTSLRTSVILNKPSNETILHLYKNRGRSYESNRHFGEKAKKGKWKAIVQTYGFVPLDRELKFTLEFKHFDQKNKNMIINNNIFHSGTTQFTYKNDKNELDYLNLSPTSSENVVNLKERKATLTYTRPHPRIRTVYDLEAYEKSLKEPVTPKIVNVTIDPNTLVEYIADGSGDGTLIGNETSNKLLGLGGDDALHGEEGDDHLYPGRANNTDKGYGGIGNDTHYVCSYEPGDYWAHDDKKGNNSIVFNISYKESVERSVDKVTKEISYKVDYTPLTLDNVKFSKNSDTEYWMQGGNKKVRFDPAEIQSVVLKHELTGKTRTYDRKAIDMLCSR